MTMSLYYNDNNIYQYFVFKILNKIKKKKIEDLFSINIYLLERGKWR